MKKYIFLQCCKDGGWGWGETGQISIHVIERGTAQDAEDVMRSYLPGGWMYVRIDNLVPGLYPSMHSGALQWRGGCSE